MHFGYTIIYVPDVSASLQFFETAFGLQRRFLHDSGTYGELETGATALAFADHSLAASHFPQGHVAAHSSPLPLGMELSIRRSNPSGSRPVATSSLAMPRASEAVDSRSLSCGASLPRS